MRDNSRKFPSLARFCVVDTPFARMMALSLLLHAFAFAPFLSRGTGRFNRAAVAYMDLNMEMTGNKAPTGSIPAARNEAPPIHPAASAEPLSEFDKLRENTRKTLNNAASQPEAVQEASLGLGMTSGYFTSIGDGDTLRDDIREYYFEMLRRVNEKWWLNSDGHGKGRRSAVFYLVIARDGKIIDRMLVESSGNPACDKAMLQALEAASPLPPLPETYRGDFFQAPLRFNLPLNLLG